MPDPAAIPRDAPAARHYGMDWLRIAAFGLLILYHVAMVFAPWDWVIKSTPTYPALVVPMAALTPWRLPLLFAVSGYASARLIDRSGDIRAFVASRTVRLGIPWGFAIVALVPPEMWVRVRQHGYPFGPGSFWTTDYWRIGGFYGVAFPSWEHLWFVVYLWAYTMLLAAAIGWAGSAAIRRRAVWLADGRRLVWAPLVLLVAAKLALLFVVPERQGLFSDWAGHAEYLPVFVFGFVLGGAPLLWLAIHRARRTAASIALLSGLVVVTVELLYQGHHVPPHGVMAIDRSARLVMAWSMILLLLHVAERHWNRDHRWRATLAEAVFPFYLIHHPAIVLLAWATLPLGLGAATEFALLLAGTVAACLAFYLVGREFSWLRPLIGLRARPHRRDAAPGHGAIRMV